MDLRRSKVKTPKVDGLEASNSLEICKVLEEKNWSFNDLLDKLINLSSFWGVPIIRV